MGTIVATKIADELATDIIFNLQIDRVGIGDYMISGYPDDYDIYVSQHVSTPLDSQVLSKVASLVKTAVESYLGGILRVGDRLVRYAQDPNQIVQLIMQFGPEANSVDELWGNLEGAIDTPTLSEEFRPLVEAAMAAKTSGDWATFYQIVMETAPEAAVNIPAMPGVAYSAESGISIPAMPGVDYGGEATWSSSFPIAMSSISKKPIPTVRKTSLFLSKSSTPVKLVKHAQGEEEETYDYLDYYTRGVEPGSREETEVLVNLDPIQMNLPPEEMPSDVSEYMEMAPFAETEEEREFSREVEEPTEEEEGKGAVPSQWELPGHETAETPYAPDVPAWWKGFWGIMGALPEYRYDALRERLDSNTAYREAADQELFVQDLREKLSGVGSMFDISGVQDPDQRALTRSRARQAAFDEVWAPYALTHAFTLAGMSGVRPHQRMLEGWMEAHFPPEYVEKFRETVALSSGANMQEQFPDLLSSIYWWRDPAEGAGHGTDPTVWDKDFLEQIPETLQIDTGLTLGDDPRNAVNIGTVTIEHPVYREFIRKPSRPEMPITYAPGTLRPDDPRNVSLEFPESPEGAESPGFVSEKQRGWWHTVGPGGGK